MGLSHVAGSHTNRNSTECDALLQGGLHTFAPIRFIVEALGGTIAWNAKTHAVTIVVGKKTIVLVIGRNYALVNGVRVPIDSNPAVVPYIQAPGRTMLPVRFISEQLGTLVMWNSTLQQVTLVFVKP